MTTLDSPRHAKHKIRLKSNERKKNLINGLTFSGCSLLSFKRWSTKNRASKGEECERMISKKSNVSFFRVTYQHRVRCIEANKLLSPADRPSLSLAVQDLLVYLLILSPYILTTVLAGLQCILPVLFQIWSQKRRPLRSEL